MRKSLRYLFVFGAGLFAGVLIAQCLIVLAARSGGNFGGEVFPLLALPLLIGAGYTIGHDHRRLSDYDKGYRRGWYDHTPEQ